MKDVPKLLEIQKAERLDMWIRLLRHKWPKKTLNIEDPVDLERQLHGHPTLLDKNGKK